MISYSIFVVDDDELVRESVVAALGGTYQMATFAKAAPAIEAIAHSPPDLVLLDIGLLDINGVEALRRIKGHHPDQLVIMVTASRELSTVISAMQLGAHDYMVKPLQLERLKLTVQNALDTIRLRKEVQLLQEQYLQENVPCFVGESAAIQDVMEFVKTVANSPDTPILILGETGTGKELIASAIHHHSPNFKGPLVSVNCAAMARELIESELFGYEKGAFTGARASGKRGLVAEAEGGTLFLDEVGDLSLEAQAKLLRFLEEGEYYRVGGTQKMRVRTRVVSATNKELESMIEQNQFRRDLYYRLGVITVQVPSLKERPEDIAALAKHFLVMFGNKFGKKLTGIASDALQGLQQYEWSGNIRELRNLMERATLVAKGSVLTIQDLALQPVARQPSPQGAGPMPLPPVSPDGLDLTALLQDIEKLYLEQALRLTQGNETKAAELLRLNYHTYRYRLRKLRER